MGLEIIGKVLGAVAPAISAFGAGQNRPSPEVVNKLPPEVQKAMMDLLPRIKKYGDTPYQGLPFRRLNEADTDPNFGSKARQDLQAYYDAEAVSNAATRKAEPEKKKYDSVFPESDNDVVSLRRMYATDPNDMSPAAKMKRLQLNKMNTALERFQDGQVNPYTGETFDKSRFLNFFKEQADYETANPRSALGFQTFLNPEQAAQIRDEQDALYRQTYIPSKSKASLIGRFGAPLALALMTAGAGAAGVPASVLKGLKGVTSLAQGVR